MNRKERRRQAKTAKIANPAATGQPSLSPPTTNETTSLMHMAVAHHRDGRLTEAVEVYRQILAAQPDFADAQHLLGVIALQRGHLADAGRLIRQAIKLQPRDGGYWNNLGVALKKMGRADEALNACREAVEWAPTSPDYWINFADCSRAAAINARDPRLYDAILPCFSQDGVDDRYLTAAQPRF